MEPNDISINLTVRELFALNKTLGIAIDNLADKIDKHGIHTKVGKGAISDQSLLCGVHIQILDAIQSLGGDDEV